MSPKVDMTSPKFNVFSNFTIMFSLTSFLFFLTIRRKPETTQLHKNKHEEDKDIDIINEQHCNTNKMQ